MVDENGKVPETNVKEEPQIPPMSETVYELETTGCSRVVFQF